MYCLHLNTGPVLIFNESQNQGQDLRIFWELATRCNSCCKCSCFCSTQKSCSAEKQQIKQPTWHEKLSEAQSHNTNWNILVTLRLGTSQKTLTLKWLLTLFCFKAKIRFDPITFPSVIQESTKCNIWTC